MIVIRLKSLNAIAIAKLLMVFIIIFYHATTSFGQEKENDRGRLPDGRAFRTDLEGAQIVDYIAELEQSIAEQNRKITSLEDENASIQKEYERVKAGRPEEISEKDLVKNKINKAFQAPKSSGCLNPRQSLRHRFVLSQFALKNNVPRLFVQKRSAQIVSALRCFVQKQTAQNTLSN